jgi:hypothetical protein
MYSRFESGTPILFDMGSSLAIKSDRDNLGKNRNCLNIQ